MPTTRDLRTETDLESKKDAGQHKGWSGVGRNCDLVYNFGCPTLNIAYVSNTERSNFFEKNEGKVALLVL